MVHLDSNTCRDSYFCLLLNDVMLLDALLIILFFYEFFMRYIFCQWTGLVKVYMMWWNIPRGSPWPQYSRIPVCIAVHMQTVYDMPPICGAAAVCLYNYGHFRLALSTLTPICNIIIYWWYGVTSYQILVSQCSAINKSQHVLMWSLTLT